MRKFIKAFNNILFAVIVCALFCAMLALFTGCHSEYKKTKAYAVFKDNLGNTYKVEGRERLKYDIITRKFSSNDIYYDYNPDAVYSFDAELFNTDSGNKITSDYSGDDDVCFSGLMLADESSYRSSITSYHDYDYTVISSGEAMSDATVKLYGSEPGTYYLYVSMSYVWDNGQDEYCTTSDYYFLVVHINGDIKNTHANAVIDDGAGGTYTIEGRERTSGDAADRVFEQTFTCEAKDVTYTFTGGLYYADGGEQITDGNNYLHFGNVYYSNVNEIVRTDKMSYQKFQDDPSFAVSVFPDRGGITIDGSQTGTYYFLISANYLIGGEWGSRAQVRRFSDYYMFVLNIV